MYKLSIDEIKIILSWYNELKKTKLISDEERNLIDSLNNFIDDE